jgi:hypothetical protein
MIDQARPMQDFRIISAGKPIRSVEEWFELAPPKKGQAQWKDGRSAKETAKAWLRTGRPAVPVEILELLNTHPATAAFQAELAFPEHVTRLDDLRGEHRNHDVLVVGEANAGLTVVAVEAKADETFGDATVGAYLARSSLNENSRAPERIRRLVRGVFGTAAVLRDESIPEPFASVRYQLVHALVGTLIEASERGAAQAVFLVHEFSSSGGTAASKLERNDRDLRWFVSVLTKKDAPTETPFLIGPIAIPGDEKVPGCAALFIGKASVDCAYTD